MEQTANPKIAYVSRGGLKLEHALEFFGLDVSGLTVLDVGSSTGGFVDCLLQHGAKKVYSVDTAYGELAWTLRQDPRVVVMERTNVLHLTELSSPSPDPSPKERGRNSELNTFSLGEGKGGAELVDLITIDASWTKLELILPVVKKFLKPGGHVIALLKPHYQAPRLTGRQEKKYLVKGVLTEDKIKEVVDGVLSKINDLGWKVESQTDSPILGGGGNKEFLIFLKIC